MKTLGMNSILSAFTGFTTDIHACPNFMIYKTQEFSKPYMNAVSRFTGTMGDGEKDKL